MSLKIDNILKIASGIDSKLAREIRKSIIEEIISEAASSDQQHGIFQNFQETDAKYPNRKSYITERGGEVPKEKYNLSKNTNPSKVKKYDEAPRSLSTRYSPDRVGVQAPLRDGVQTDPITGKKYDWNNGFTTDSGETFPGGSVSLQSDLY